MVTFKLMSCYGLRLEILKIFRFLKKKNPLQCLYSLKLGRGPWGITLTFRFNAGWDIPVGRASGFGLEVLGSNLSLGGHSRGSITILRCRIGTRPWHSELTLRIITCSDGFTLALTPVGRVK